MNVTRTIGAGPERAYRRRLRLRVSRGPDATKTLTSSAEHTTIGTSDDNDLVLSDSAVSRYHLRVSIERHGVRITDLGSTNGTRAHGLRVASALAEGPIDLEVGESTIRVEPLDEEAEIALSEGDRFGAALGRSAAMRELFRTLDSAAKRDVTILLSGETGTGKELIAREIHAKSPRRDGPFVVVDCGAIPPGLIESELFGHVRGAYTSAERDRGGAFEAARGGTILLDEIGELELGMQPKLLRVLERREIKRVGETSVRPIDARVIAATHRDLQLAVNQGSFRADLYYRLAVVRVTVPPLRQRPEDVELIFDELLEACARRMGVSMPALDAKTRQQLVSHPWPGNVRELRNFVERLVALSGELEPSLALEPPRSTAALSVEDLLALPFKEAKAQWAEHFDQRYLGDLLERTGGNVAEAARLSGIDRVHLFRLIKKYGLRG